VKSFETLEVEVDGPVRIVQMIRPKQRNAVNAQMHGELCRIWRELASAAEVKAVVLCGSAGVFSAGGDMDWLSQLASDPDERWRAVQEGGELVSEMLAFPLPIVAAVQGPAVGLGSSLVSLCDLAIMGDSAFIADPHVPLGVVAADGAVVTWPFLMSMTRAKEHLYTGDKIDAQLALEIGMVTRVVAHDQVIPEAISLAHHLAAQPAAALKATKRALNLHIQRAASGVLEFALAAEAHTFGDPAVKRNIDRMTARST
jgi:enoyl-CoA hydratase